MINEPIPHSQLEVRKEYYCPYGYKHRGVSGCTIEIVSKSSKEIIYYKTSGGCQDPYPLAKDDTCYKIGSEPHKQYELELQINGVRNKIERIGDDIPASESLKTIWENTLTQLTELKDSPE